MPTIHGIRIGEFGRLGVDEQNRLYWDGKPLITKQAVTVDWWLATAAIVTAVSTAALAIVGILQLCKCC